MLNHDHLFPISNAIAFFCHEQETFAAFPLHKLKRFTVKSTRSRYEDSYRIVKIVKSCTNC